MKAGRFQPEETLFLRAVASLCPVNLLTISLIFNEIV